ncbi:ATP-binding protein [Arcobacter sp. LA11]|uniref:sensor histidine kinase n=1 Tax=Arcobacter sp. LA11 TaxID=1898176 RepID=UPI000932DC28|nr:ATP-binding protein [Arcobacter sp. LA11]
MSPKIKNNIPILTTLSIFIIDLILILTTHLNWNNAMNKYLPLKSQIQTFKSDISTGHLWFEEAIAGDKYIDLENDVMLKFKHKEFFVYIDNSKNVLKSDEDLFFYTNLKKIKEKANNFYELANKRWNNVLENGIGSDSDQIFDKEFNSMILLVDELNRHIDKRISQELQDREQYFKFILILFFLLNSIVFVVLYFTKLNKMKYEAELYEEKKRAEITLYSIGDAVITTDEKGYILFLNPIAQKLTEYSLEEAKGKYLDEVFDIFNEQTKEKVDTPVKRVLEEGIIVGLANHTALKSKNDNVYSIEDSAAPIKDEKGNILGTILVFHDVTEQTKLRKKLNYNEKMMMQQSKLASMGEMLENIAHQWRQPLSTITTAASGIKVEKEFNLLTDESFEKNIDEVLRSSSFLSKTIDDFRDFFKPNNEKILFNINTLLTNALNIISSKFKYYDVQIIKNCEDIQIRGFSTELLQVFITILNNSNDALSDVKKEEKMIFIDAFKSDKKVIIIIKDSAGGMKDSLLHRIFEPYFTTKHKSQGKGIGLYMVEEIITKHMNGRINVCNKDFEYNNTKLRGLEFTIELYID